MIGYRKSFRNGKLLAHDHVMRDAHREQHLRCFDIHTLHPAQQPGPAALPFVFADEESPVACSRAPVCGCLTAYIPR